MALLLVTVNALKVLTHFQNAFNFKHMPQFGNVVVLKNGKNFLNEQPNSLLMTHLVNFYKLQD